MTFSLNTATISEMKTFATVNNILITGDKRLKENWAGAIERWQYVTNEAAACLADADAIAVQADDVAEVVATKAVAVVTSPAAITAYKSIFHVVALVLALVGLLSWKLIQWGWAHRSDVALAHWIVALRGSKIGHRTRVWIRWVRRKLNLEMQSVVMCWIVDRLGRVGGPVSWI